MSARVSTGGLAKISARHPWRMVAIWILILVLAAISAPALGDALTTQETFTNTPESLRGENLLEGRFRGERPMNETVIVRSETATVDDAGFQTTVEKVTSELTAMTGIVKSATNYYATGDAQLVSADRHATIIPVVLAGTLDDATDHVTAVEAALDRQAAASGFEIVTVGDASINEELTKISEEDLAAGEQIGLPVALLILIVVFGALVAAGLPIALGVLSVFVAIGMAAVAGRFFDLSFFIVNMIGMIGLAVGIDYALFVVSRFREERRRGFAKIEAIELAGATANKAVLFSGGTVILALSGMLLVPNSVFRALGLGAVLVVIAALAATLTLLPATLSLLGDRVDWPRRRKLPAEQSIQPATALATTGFWARMTHVVMARPVVSLVGALVILIAAALPMLQMNKGAVGVSGLPEGTRARAAYTVLQRDFAAGTVAPIEVVVDGPVNDPVVTAAIDRFVASLPGNGPFGAATVTRNPAGDLALISFPLTIAPDSQQAYKAIEHIRDDLAPLAFKGTGAGTSVSGQTAFNYDFIHQVEDYTPYVFAYVLGLSFLLLLVAFRSIVVPVKAIVMNLLSVGAAYGLVVWVFQEGHGASLFGFDTVPAIEAWLPLFLFCVLFGLSMDYHVFLLSRIREHYDLTRRNTESVAVGLQSTAKIITGAAAIMVAVFAGFAAGRLVSLQQVGFGLAVAVFLDATVVRSVLVPASMALLGDRNWYFPRVLHRLPDLSIEGPAAHAPVLGIATASGDD